MYQLALENLVLGDILRERATTHRDQAFLKFLDGDRTYGEVSEMAQRLAAGLAAHGVKRGTHVAVMLPNIPEIVYLTFALAQLGAVIVPINPACMGDLLQHVLKNSNASTLIIDAEFLEQLAGTEPSELSALTSVVVYSASGDSVCGSLLGRPTISLSHLFKSGGDAPRVAVRFSDLQGIMYTSGTTGPSKGVLTSHAHALTCALDSLNIVDYQLGETIYCPLPLFHAGSLWDGVMTALLGGLSIAIVDRFSASRFWDDVRYFRANVAMGVFAMMPILLNRPPTPRDKDHPLRAFYVGKSALNDPFYERFGVRSVESYTSTEIGIGTCTPYGESRPGSCGTINRSTFDDVKIVDDQDREVEPGQAGELVLRPKVPYVITTGYYNSPRATASCFRNLWFHTGDRAFRDEDGYFYFIDRIKDSIRRRGDNISAFELEREINSHPAVLESAAFGVPSELEEDDVKVAVVLHCGADLSPQALEAHCNQRLPPFMVPRYIEFVDELPKTSTGKVCKHELRRQGRDGITPGTWDGAPGGRRKMP